jgi:hypothetical protein
MAIKARMAAESNRDFFLGIERTGDGALFNFAKGAFEATESPMKLPSTLYPFSQDPEFPGRYTIDAPHQQLLQFNGVACCFWLIRNTGQPTPNHLETVWMESAILTPSSLLDQNLIVLSLTEPQTAF